MSNNQKNRKRYLPVGAMILSKDADDKGRKSYYIKLSDKTKITIDGVDVSGKYINVQRPADKFDRMLASGKITQEEYDEKVNQFSEGGNLSFITFELTAALD